MDHTLFGGRVRKNERPIARVVGEHRQTPEEYKAWSQNLRHQHVLTTFPSYGNASNHRQAQIIRAMSNFR
jgi:hypothetical protein